MKELSIEEKARRYDEAIEIAKEINNEKCAQPFNVMTRVFPELKESEDEKMRKSIIYALRNGGFYNSDKTDEAIAWLEKQSKNDSQVILPQFSFDDILALQCCMETVKKVKEDKDLYKKLEDLHGRIYDAYYFEKQGDKADKVEPIFNLYDWVVTDKGDIVQIGAVNNGYYTIHNGMDFNKSYVDKHWHLWTIKDAKDGDVLRLGDVIAIFKSIFKNSIGSSKCVCYCSFYKDEGFEIPIENGKNNVYGCTNTTPATKEQRDLLFTKMKEAGYEWDAYKKELIKL